MIVYYITTVVTDINTYIGSYSKNPEMCGTLFDNSDRQIRTHLNDDIFQFFTQLEQQRNNILNKNALTENKPPPIRRIRILDSRIRSVIRIATKIVSLGL